MIILDQFTSSLIFTTTFVVIFVFLLLIMGLIMIWLCIVPIGPMIAEKFIILNKKIKKIEILNEKIEENTKKNLIILQQENLKLHQK